MKKKKNISFNGYIIIISILIFIIGFIYNLCFNNNSYSVNKTILTGLVIIIFFNFFVKRKINKPLN